MNNQTQNLADKITAFFERFDMMGGATSEEMYEATYNALASNNSEEIKIIKDYFRDIRWANQRAQEIYRELDLYYGG